MSTTGTSVEHICGTLLKVHCTLVQVSILIPLSMAQFAEIETASSTSAEQKDLE